MASFSYLFRFRAGPHPEVLIVAAGEHDAAVAVGHDQLLARRVRL
jgi:hypothetical protein